MSGETAAIATSTSVPNEPSGEIANTVHVESEVISSQKSQKRKLFITIGCVFFICLLMGIAAIIYGLSGHDQVFKTKTNNVSSFEITPDMILPNTTIIVHDNTTTTISGDIMFYDMDVSTNGIKFNWKSFQNETYAFIQFMMDMEDDTLTDFELFNGFSGFEINVNDLHKPNSTEMAPDAALNILMFKLDLTSTPQTITLSAEDESSSMTESKQTSFEDLFCGYIGEYFVELSIKLGSINFVGKDNVAVNSIHQYSRLLYSLVSKSDHKNQWKWNEIDDAITLTNRISKNITSLVKGDINNNNDMNEKNNMNEEEKRRLQTSSCSATWYWLGDGYCDSSANNAACNWDNGDCCDHTCKTAIYWEDNDGTGYTGYSCGSNGYNCVPGCNVANPSWLGDGYCDKTGGYNTEECGYDLGDCCEDTCSDAAYSCGSAGYDCKDSSPNYCSREKSGCDNPCIGLCGTDCSCWTWTCGDCHCHGECGEHDTYCSCSWWGLLHFWCIDVFWIHCDDGSSAVF